MSFKIEPWALTLTLTLAFGMAGASHAVTAVNPFGVNVRSSGPSTVFLSFQNLAPDETAAEAFWCGELRPDLMAANPQLQLPVAVQSRNPCMPGTVYGRLPAALDRSRTSRSGAFANLTDIMTIPASVARRAFQDAQAGAHSAFFYVRRFVSSSGERYVVVTCRMGGGGARTPLALWDVRIEPDKSDAADAVVPTVEPGQALPAWSVRLRYNGSGNLRGRWEVVQPGDALPTEDDLLPAASLPVERRALQRRWTLLERFDLFLPPTGEARLPGPDPRRVPTRLDGPHQLLLRIEATDDKEGSSNTGEGRVALAGGVAGFAMPVLRYHVTAPADASAGLRLLMPAAGELAADAAPTFGWTEAAGATLYRLELQTDPGARSESPADGAGRQDVFAAWLPSGQSRYTVPPWFVEARRGQALRWRVLALDAQGGMRAVSDWRSVSLR